MESRCIQLYLEYIFLLCVSPIQHGGQSGAQTEDGRITSSAGSATVEHTTVAGTSQGVGNRCPLLPPSQEQSTLQRPAATRGKHQFDPLGGIPLLRKHLQPYGIDKVTLDRIVSAAWRPGTVKLYAHYIRKWQMICYPHNLDTLNHRC